MSDVDFRVESVSPQNWTLVPPDTSIVVRFNQSVDARSAQVGITLLGQAPRGVVRLDDDATVATWTPLGPFPEGDYTLVVTGVTTREGRTVVTPHRSHFEVAATTTPERPYGQIVLHRSTTRLRNSDRQYAVSKLLDPHTGRRSVVAIDERGEQVDLDRLIAEDARITFERYGKVHPTLFDEISRRDESDRLPVAIWIAFREQFVDKSEFDLDTCDEPPDALLGYRERIRRAIASASGVIRDRCDNASLTPLQAAPVILANLTSGQIRTLATLNTVSALFLYESEGIEDVVTSMKTSGAYHVVNVDGWNASGVRVAVWEDGPDNTSQLAIADQFSASAIPSSHARLVTGIIRNTQTGFAATLSGKHDRLCYAPAARIYSANTMDVAALEWAVADRECRVVNQSFHDRSEARSSDQSFEDILKDYMVIHHPFPTIVHAAGNYSAGDLDMVTPPADEYVNHKGFNTISVGNHDDTAQAMDGGSVFRNPSSTHGDRELPEICANGITVTAAGFTDSGTSFASPAVAGSVALLQQIDRALASWPEGSRAILFASAVNVAGRSWARDLRAGVDASDGAGALDIREGARIARQRVTAENPGQQRGWNAGTLRPGDFDPNTGYWRYSYRIRVPMIGASSRVKVALAWDIMGTEVHAPFMTVWMATVPNDYDLHIFDDKNALVSWSASWDNSYEIAEFTGTPGKTYTVRILKGAGDEMSYYGIAWTVRDDDFASVITSEGLNATLLEP